jgi:hypothetical protein
MGGGAEIVRNDDSSALVLDGNGVQPVRQIAAQSQIRSLSL